MPAPLTRPEVVTLALYDLGGSDDAVDTEDIAVRASALAPGMFAWQKYSEQIDKDLVRVALSDAKLKKKYVVGSHKKGGWMLTGSGQEYAQANLARVVDQPQRRRRGSDEQSHNRERARLMTSPAYARYQSGELAAMTDDEADAFFRLNAYVHGQPRDRKIARIENQFGDDPELGELVQALAERARTRGAT